MKELSIEEKAKRYDEKLVKAKRQLEGAKVFDYKDGQIAHDIRTTIYEIFPELKESDGDSIRKEMLDYCYKRMNNEFLSITIDQVERWAAWLEKQGEHQKFRDSIQVGDRVTRNEDGVLVNLSQLNRVAKKEEPTYTQKDLTDAYLKGLEDAKSTEINEDPCIDCDQRAMNCHNFPCDRKKAFEQKPTDKVEPKFHEGDWLIYENGSIYYVNKVYEHTYELVIDNGDKPRIPHELIDKKARLWTIQDAKDGDVLYTPKGAGVEGIFLIEGWEQVECTGKTLFSSIGYRVKDDKIVTGGLGAIWWEGVIDIFYPATKEQRDLLFQKMKEAGYEWDAEKKELKKIGQKPVWSEEDEELYKDALDAFEALYNELEPAADWGELYSWLKSLKGKIQPKQEWSEEDSVRLQRIIDFLWYNRKGDTDTIYQQEQDIDWLKSLRPQNRCAYNPYKAVVDSIAEMCKHYDKANHSGLRDFYDNVKVKCKDAKEYDSLYPQNTWKPSDEQIEALSYYIKYYVDTDGVFGRQLVQLYQDLLKLRRNSYE